MAAPFSLFSQPPAPPTPSGLSFLMGVPPAPPPPSPAPAVKLTTEQKADLAILKAAQDSEIALLKDAAKDAGLSSKEINALIAQEKKANTAEYNEAKKTGVVEKTSGGTIVSDIAVAQLAGLLPKAQQAVSDAQSRVNDSVQFIEANDLQQGGAKKGVGTLLKTGYVLSEISQAATPEEAKTVALDMQKSGLVSHGIEAIAIADELKTSAPQAGENVKQVKNNAGIDPKLGTALYTTKTVGDGRTLTTVYFQAPDGETREVGNTYQSVNTKEGLGLVGNLVIGALGSFVLGPAIAGALGGGAGAAIGAGALTGGITSEITGGDFLQGAVTGGVGAATSVFGKSLSDSIASNLVSNGLSAEVARGIANAAASAASGAVKSAIAGQDVLTGAGLSAVGSAVQSSVNNALVTQFGLDSRVATTLANSVANAAATGVVAAVQGQDVGLAIGQSIGTTLGGAAIRGELTYAPIVEKGQIATGDTNVEYTAGDPNIADKTRNIVASADTGTMTDLVAEPVVVTPEPRPAGLYASIAEIPQGQALFDALTLGALKPPTQGAAYAGKVAIDPRTYQVLKDFAERFGSNVALPYKLEPGSVEVSFRTDAPEIKQIVQDVDATVKTTPAPVPTAPPAVAPTPVPSPASITPTPTTPPEVVPKDTAATTPGAAPPTETAGMPDIPGLPGAAGEPSGGGGGGGGGSQAGGTAGGAGVAVPGVSDRDIFELITSPSGTFTVPSGAGLSPTQLAGATTKTGVGGGTTATTGAGTDTGIGTGVGGGVGSGAGTGTGTGTGTGVGSGVGEGVGEGAGPGAGPGAGGIGGGPGGAGAGGASGGGGADGGGGGGGTVPPDSGGVLTPSPIPTLTDSNLITFLGLTPTPTQKTTPVQRGSAPSLYVGGEEGDLNALFGGKPEELQDVWNQSSLRLRSALGI